MLSAIKKITFHCCHGCLLVYFLFMICPFLKWALLLFLTDDAKIRTICEVCKSCTREGRKDVRPTAINHWLANSCNSKKHFFNRFHRQLAMRNKPRPGRCHNVSRSKCVIFVFGCPESLYIKYIYLIYILYRPLTALSFFILTHFDLDPF